MRMVTGVLVTGLVVQIHLWDMGLSMIHIISEWRIGPSPGGAELFSGSVTWCPTSPRAAICRRLDISSWQYLRKDWQDGDIRVTRGKLMAAYR